jgi:hypothetical protein
MSVKAEHVFTFKLGLWVMIILTDFLAGSKVLVVPEIAAC